MIKLLDLEKELEQKKIHNVYALCSIDGKLIKDIVEKIKYIVLGRNFMELNHIKMDGSKIEGVGDIINACESMPFMSDKKLVEIFNFEIIKKNKNESFFKGLSEYLKDVPSHCILIMYYMFENDREKPSKFMDRLGKTKGVCFCKLDKIKGMELNKKVKDMFDLRKEKINRSDLNFFCSQVDNNMNIIEHEVEKLCSYTYGRDIVREDIIAIMPQKGENDIFNLVDFLSQRKINKAVDILNELVYRGEPIFQILSMIERQFKMLLIIKLGINDGKDKDDFSRELKLPSFICENLMRQSAKFKEEKLKEILGICIESERRMKSLSIDNKTEVELLMMNTLIV